MAEAGRERVAGAVVGNAEGALELNAEELADVDRVVNDLDAGHREPRESRRPKDVPCL